MPLPNPANQVEQFMLNFTQMQHSTIGGPAFPLLTTLHQSKTLAPTIFSNR
jgi:hypothetical protein